MNSARPTHIPRVRFVGDTWYDRGWPYRRLRFGISVVRFFGMVMTMWGVGIFTTAIVSIVPSTFWKVVVVVACVIPVVGSCWSARVQLRRTPEQRAAHYPFHFPDNPNVSTKGAAGVGVAAAGGAALVGFFLALSSLFIVGHVIGLFLSSLGRYLTEQEWDAARAFGLEPDLPNPSAEFRRAHPVYPRHIYS